MGFNLAKVHRMSNRFAKTFRRNNFVIYMKELFGKKGCLSNNDCKYFTQRTMDYLNVDIEYYNKDNFNRNVREEVHIYDRKLDNEIMKWVMNADNSKSIVFTRFINLLALLEYPKKGFYFSERQSFGQRYGRDWELNRVVYKPDLLFIRPTKGTVKLNVKIKPRERYDELNRDNNFCQTIIESIGSIVYNKLFVGSDRKVMSLLMRDKKFYFFEVEANDKYIEELSQIDRNKRQEKLKIKLYSPTDGLDFDNDSQRLHVLELLLDIKQKSY